MRRLSVSASNLGQLDDACAHVGSSARKETKTETNPDPKMLSGSARGDHQRLFQQHRSIAATRMKPHAHARPLCPRKRTNNGQSRYVRLVPLGDIRIAANSIAIRSPRRRARAASKAECSIVFTPGVLEFVRLTGPLARPGVLGHLSRMVCRNPRRTTHKLVAGEKMPLGICPHGATAWRGWSPRAAPTNGPAGAVQSSTPTAVQLPPHLSCPALRASRPAADTAQLQKTAGLFFLLFELPRPAKRGQPQADRGSRGRRRHGPDKAYDGAEQRCCRQPQ